jgi:hypothetical protein
MFLVNSLRNREESLTWIALLGVAVNSFLDTYSGNISWVSNEDVELAKGA